MAKLQQLLLQLVIGTMAFGGVACLCQAATVAQAAPADGHAHHQHGTVLPDGTTQQPDCGHEDCETDCERGSAVASSAVASKGSGSPVGKTVLQLDDVAIPPRGFFVFAPPPVQVVSTSSYRLRVPLPQKTPVQRCDRLLD